MAAFAKGHEKLGGRKPNTPNKGTQSIRALLDAELPEDELRKLWHKYLYNKNLAIAFEAFKLANQYKFGRPAASPINEEDAPQHMGPQFDLSQISTRHVPYVPVTEK
jgi:hypothetical protein